MGSGLPIFLLITCLQVLVIAAVTDSGDLSALNAVKSNWMNTPPSWIGSDPCGGDWEGIGCTGSRITYIILTGMGLSGTLTGDIGDFPELQTLWVLSMFSCPLFVQLSCLKIQ
ncbi:LEUCINE-RICH REPEAT RECEPTOR-LIKE PROTEIN KINASE-RELATED [Salix viminalis]|uniref:LEUCINE-RICH REPEAT RECEPTOR-LIKE PROTEIN KINASE-RELATED n=1 Tax=Salix viminalis TaxID=40686 RepID=A0A9Q0TPY6_SALVM|nr:LEUCINE-RICH REPEAT RECEPTOR-LIKE PROTEIN KINASE-RELATED [Salix viminalis]